MLSVTVTVQQSLVKVTNPFLIRQPHILTVSQSSISQLELHRETFNHLSLLCLKKVSLQG